MNCQYRAAGAFEFLAILAAGTAAAADGDGNTLPPPPPASPTSLHADSAAPGASLVRKRLAEGMVRQLQTRALPRARSGERSGTRGRMVTTHIDVASRSRRRPRAPARAASRAPGRSSRESF